MVNGAHIPLLAISLMNCRNTKLVREAAPGGTRRKRRRFKGIRWHRLVVDQRPGSLGESIGANGLKHSLHICRGHFKDYRESGLFGQHKGVYWWHQYLRGDVETGVVHKDYEVRT